jgi:SAM-dependent methyltransferase
MTRCPVCESDNNQPFIHMGNSDHAYYLCECSCAFLHPMMTADELNTWYASGEYRTKTEQADPGSKLAKIQHKQRAEYIVELLGTMKPTRHLDIGCSSGELLREIKAKHPGVVQAGVDPDPTVTTDEFDIRKNINEVKGTFDLVTLIQTLEHISEPAKMMFAIWERMKTGSILVVEVPNRHADIISFIPPQHVIAYDEKSLKYAMADFRIIKTILHGRPYNSPLDNSILMLATRE